MSKDIKVVGVTTVARSECKLPREVGSISAEWDTANSWQKRSITHDIEGKLDPNMCEIVTFENWNGYKKGVGVLWAVEEKE